MARSKPFLLRPDWLPAVALSAALAAAMLAWNPPVGDLAAQVFRTELFQRGGLAIWNGSWYGGHYTLTYSVLFPPLAALLGPRLVGTLAVAFGLAALRALQTRRPAVALVAGAACALSSPVAAAFLAGVILAGTLPRDRRTHVAAIWVACLALGLVIVPNIAFPEGGEFPFAFSSYMAIPLWCGGALLLTR